MSMSDKFRDERREAETGLKKAADKGQEVVDTAQSTAREVLDSAKLHAQNLASQVADGVTGAVDTFRERDYGEMVDQGRDFARRNPGLVIAGVALASFMAGRYLSKPAPTRSVTVAGRRIPFKFSS